MKKREIVIAVLLIIFGVVYNVVEKGRVRLSGDVAGFFDPMRLVSDRYREFPQTEQLFPAPGKLTISNPAGEISVDRSPDNRVHLSAYFRVYSHKEQDAEAIAKNARVLARVENDDLAISVECLPEFPFRRLRTRLHLLVPSGTILDLANRKGVVSIRHCGKDLFLRQENGNVVLENIPSAVTLELTHGSLHAKNIAGSVIIATRQSEVFLEGAASLRLQGKHSECQLRKVHGQVWIDHAYGQLQVDDAGSVEVYGRHSRMTLRRIRQGLKLSNAFDGVLIENVEGDISVSGRSSDIEIRHVVAGTMVVENAFAETRIDDFSGDTMNARIKNGNLVLNANAITGRLNVESSYARIELTVGGWSDPALSLKTTHGRIFNHSTLSLDVFQERDENFANRSGLKPEVFINNVYGDIHLH